MTQSAPPDHQQQQDYMFVTVLCMCALIVPAAAAGVFSLQRQLQPAEAVLFGPTANGELMFAIPTILIGLLASVRVAWTITRCIRRGFGMRDKDPVVLGAWAKSPLEFVMRHYEWKEVINVSVHCRNSQSKSKRRFRYVIEMSDRQDVDLSGALSGVSAQRGAASAVRFAEFIPSRLNTVPGIQYEFDVSRDALASLGKRRGVVLSNALREQVLGHGGTLQ